MNEMLIIVGMAVVTLAVKAAFFVLGRGVVFPDWLSLGLGFVPVAVLAAIIVPGVLMPHGHGVELTGRNAYLVAAVTAIGVAAVSRRQLPTIVTGMVTFVAWRALVVG
ncbi:MAG: AzlD domain-containing protein [Azospirillaceae bacterium]|nr:AzlD domain-containing protein [Azospirillaceae bacterium]